MAVCCACSATGGAGHRRVERYITKVIFCFSTCVDSIRTIPVVQRLEDLDTKSEDHAVDDWRYACNSRPWLKAAPKKVEPVHPRSPTFKELTDA